MTALNTIIPKINKLLNYILWHLKVCVTSSDDTYLIVLMVTCSMTLELKEGLLEGFSAINVTVFDPPLPQLSNQVSLEI